MTKWLKKYAETYGYQFTDGSSNGEKLFQITTLNGETLQVETKEQDIWDELNEIAKK
jgi:hypothetical protein